MRFARRSTRRRMAGRSRATIVLGVLQLILWALFIVVTAKYVLLLLRADNNGEGGTLSLMALGQRALGRRSWPLLALGVIGASMFIGNSMITPAISVLSAVEGLKLAAPALAPLRGAADGVHPRGAVLGAEQRHRPRRGGFRAGHDGLVRHAGGVGPAAYQRRSRRCWRRSTPGMRSSSCSRTAPSAW